MSQVNQPKIATDQIFDRDAAERIFKSVLASGEATVVIDLHEVRRVLPEGIRALKERLDSLQKAMRVELSGLEEPLTVQFQIYGFVVERGSVVFDRSIPRQGGTPPGLIEIICKKCMAPSALYEPGLFICPACGARLYADRSGRTVYYEPLQPYHP
jgi:hypothetical protein